MMVSNAIISVPDSCLPLLREHRTHYGNEFVKAYCDDLEQTFHSFCDYLPKASKAKPTKILDIGCGMAGIDIYLSRFYLHEARITLLDKNGCSEKINAGFHECASTFSHYHDFNAALHFLNLNNVPQEILTTIDISTDKFPAAKFNVVISLLSWGFHYPIETYKPKVAKGGVIIADVRRGTAGEERLAEYGDVRVVCEAQKFRRVVVQC